MFGIRGLLGKGIFLILTLGIASLLVSYAIVDSKHQAELQSEFSQIRTYHGQATENMIAQRLEQLTLVAEEIYLLGGLQQQTVETIQPVLNDLWPKLQMTFALSSMVLKQGDNELIYGSVSDELVESMYSKTMITLRPQAKFICRPVCSLVAIIPTFVDGNQAALFVAADISSSVASIKSILQSDMAILIDAKGMSEDQTSFAINDSTFIADMLTNAINTRPALEKLTNVALMDAAITEGVLIEVEQSKLFVWATLFKNDTDTLPIVFIRDVENLLLNQQAQKTSFLTIIASIAASILAIISLTSFRPIQRLSRLKRTITFIGKKQYDNATNALGKVKTGKASDEIDALEREFNHSITQLIEYEAQLNESQERLTKMATIDVTTKLLNRNAFLEDMQALQASLGCNQTTLMFLDLDGFKSVNDNLGHVVGDLLLEKVGARLNPLAHDGIRVYRIGGDEFLVAIADIKTLYDLTDFCERLLHLFDQAFVVENHNISVSSSIGVVSATAETNSYIDLLKQADIAMYQAKAAGKNQYCFFDNKMMEQINLRYIIQNEFAEALAGNQLSLVYQPIVDAKNGKLIKLEALSRWMHPEIGFIRPDIFIEVIEETPHISALSAWLISQAAAKVKELDQSGLNDVVVSINISGAQVTDINSINLLMDECNKANISFQRIELEITETSLISDFKKAQDWITKVTKLGFRIAIDDFGTGYSSLSYLTAFPFDCVKLDRSLLLDVEENERTCNIVRSVTHMIHALGVPVVAEGIETKNHLEVIKTLGCDYVQGYYFSRPLPSKELAQQIVLYCERGEWLAA